MGIRRFIIGGLCLESGIYKGKGWKTVGKVLGERSFHQPTINKIEFHDALGEEKRCQILFFFLHCALQLDKPCWKGVIPIAPTK